MFALTSAGFSVTCRGYDFYFIHLSWEKTTAAVCISSVKRKLQQWAQGCVYSHMHDVIEYRSNICVCVCACEQEKRNHCCWMCMLEGLLYVKREEHSISSTYIHTYIKSNYLLSSFFLYIWQFQSFIFDNHET
jgi:hypothetical protein